MSEYYNLIPGVNYRQPSSGPLTYDWVHPDQPATCAELSDFEVARRVRMLMRNQLDFENVCVMARDRIMALSKMVAQKESAPSPLNRRA